MPLRSDHQRLPCLSPWRSDPSPLMSASATVAVSAALRAPSERRQQCDRVPELFLPKTTCSIQGYLSRLSWHVGTDSTRQSDTPTFTEDTSQCLKTIHHVRDSRPECHVHVPFRRAIHIRSQPDDQEAVPIGSDQHLRRARVSVVGNSGGGTTVIVRDCRIAGRDAVGNSGTATSTTPCALHLGRTGQCSAGGRFRLHHWWAIEAVATP